MRAWAGFIALLILVIRFGYCAEGRPMVLVYSSEMTAFAQHIADGLMQEFEDVEFKVIDDPSLLSSLLPMPDTGCVILPVMRGAELTAILEPLITYFGRGGAAIGFQGCTSPMSTGDLARVVFPVLGNATGSSKNKGGIPVDEYLRDANMKGFEDLPDEFDLPGLAFAYSADSAKNPIDPEPEAGTLTVLFRDKEKGAPLVIAYENEAGSRSVTYAGMFVRATETASNYYGKLLENPIFLKLLADSLAWTLEGATRSSLYEANCRDLIETERERLGALRSHAEMAESGKARRRLIYLALIWVLGLLAIAGLIYAGFLRGDEAGPVG